VIRHSTRSSDLEPSDISDAAKEADNVPSPESSHDGSEECDEEGLDAEAFIIIPQLLDWAADILSWRDQTRTFMAAGACTYGLFFSFTYKWSFSSIVAHCLLLRIMYKSCKGVMIFAGVKGKKNKPFGQQMPSNMYSLKHLYPSWKRLEDLEDPMTTVKAMLILWGTAVVGRHISDAVAVSAVVVVGFLLSFAWWMEGGWQVKGQLSRTEKLARIHDRVKAHFVKLPSTHILLAVLVVVYFVFALVLKAFDYVLLALIFLIFLRSFADGGLADAGSSVASKMGSVASMMGRIMHGILRSVKKKITDLIQGTAKAEDTPDTSLRGSGSSKRNSSPSKRTASPKRAGSPSKRAGSPSKRRTSTPVRGRPATPLSPGKLAGPITPAARRATAPVGSLQTPSPGVNSTPRSGELKRSASPGTVVRRRNSYFDSKLGSTNKKAVQDDAQMERAKKAGFLSGLE